AFSVAVSSRHLRAEPPFRPSEPETPGRSVVPRGGTGWNASVLGDGHSPWGKGAEMSHIAARTVARRVIGGHGGRAKAAGRPSARRMARLVSTAAVIGGAV